MSRSGTEKNRTVPGVYITELPAFPPSIVGVQTAVPIFIGYTETAFDSSGKATAYLKAIPITSMAEYCDWFGYGYTPGLAVSECPPAQFEFTATKPDATLGYYRLDRTVTAQFNLFQAMRLFFANGGGGCYVVSVGNYQGGQTAAPDPALPAVAIDRDALSAGLTVAGGIVGPTMTVVPDACLLASDADYGAIAVAQTHQAAELEDRVAILDLPGALDPSGWTKAGLAARRDAFYKAIDPVNADSSYGTAYAPALRTSVLGTNDIDVTDFQPNAAAAALLKGLLLQQSADLYGGNPSKKTQVDAKIEQAFPATPPVPPPTPQQSQSLNQFLINTLPLLEQIETIALGNLNVAPPSGAMAGIWTQNDDTRGVWNAPANMSLNQVVAPVVLLDDTDQGDYNVPLNGYAIDILRAFVNRGTVVWGARTLDGNSEDYRYIQVRRTLVYIEQSIKTALQPFVFAANDGQTWVTVAGMVSNFLTGLWTQGGLMGDKASDAFNVQVGLGTTMTGQDILNGYMIVQVTLQMIHPAEFIELTFKQQMQGTG